MVKLFLGRHRVLYRGRYDGEGTIHGTWSIGGKLGKDRSRSARCGLAFRGFADSGHLLMGFYVASSGGSGVAPGGGVPLPARM